ncbi:MAG: cupin domain-containing protein [Tannerella sp.]|jgi:quercetin dioxygenase-like cupin family protein|nr:cupin domain-containing protein [Tannerella sp.]
MKKVVILSLLAISCLSVQLQGQVQAPAWQEADSDSSLVVNFLKGNVFLINGEQSVRDLPWNPHPSFKGVALKHLLLGKDSENQVSCHIVRIEPGCMLDTHIHDGKAEIHEVVAGSGKMYLDGREIEYSVGTLCLIPANTKHKVVAGKNGMYLFAKFLPALQ